MPLKKISRRKILQATGLAAAASLISACNNGGSPDKPAESTKTIKKKREWKMVTTWPKNFPGLGTGAQRIADNITSMSDGRLTVKLFAAGELVPAFECFDAVRENKAQMFHASPYYWINKNKSMPFFGGVPGGVTAQEHNAWINYAGGQKLWDEMYAQFGLKPFMGGNSGTQMGGWFLKEINSVEDFKGLKMRIPGLAAEVLNRMGGTAVALPGGEIMPALQSGAIDATEWVGPYNDLTFGFHQAAKYYYYPGWHEPGPMLELIINIDAWNSLPKHLQVIIETAAKAVNQEMLDEYLAMNNQALIELVEVHGVELRKLPDDVIEEFREISNKILEDLAKEDETIAKVYESYTDFKNNVSAYHEISEDAFIESRNK